MVIDDSNYQTKTIFADFEKHFLPVSFKKVFFFKSQTNGRQMRNKTNNNISQTLFSLIV